MAQEMRLKQTKHKIFQFRCPLLVSIATDIQTELDCSLRFNFPELKEYEQIKIKVVVVQN